MVGCLIGLGGTGDDSAFLVGALVGGAICAVWSRYKYQLSTITFRCSVVKLSMHRSSA
jgi:hypothetical protein